MTATAAYLRDILYEYVQTFTVKTGNRPMGIPVLPEEYKILEDDFLSSPYISPRVYEDIIKGHKPLMTFLGCDFLTLEDALIIRGRILEEKKPNE